MKCVTALLSGADTPVVIPATALSSQDVVLAGPTQISSLPYCPPPPCPQTETYIMENMYGQSLLPQELPETLESIFPFIRAGDVYLQAGIERYGRKYKCRRCGNEEQIAFARYDCSWCGEACMYCRSCIMMGKVTTCTPLFTWQREVSATPIRSSLTWEGTFTPAQDHAAHRIATLVKGKEAKMLLVWAVCGAGKTEMLFPGLEAAFELGKRVLLATPRTDVVLELLPRMKRSFPSVPLIGLYGGSDQRGKSSQFVLATTHQTRRFQDAFDVVIVDEVDAFPYSYDRTLAYAVHRAAKPDAAFIYLTATPDKKLLSQSIKENALVKVPRRYHGFPLPVPISIWAGDWRKKLKRQQLSPVFEKWCGDQLAKGRPSLIFTPSVETANSLQSCLQKFDARIASVHAGDPDRKTIVQAFRAKEIPMLVTTTILERGVTIPGIDVAIIGAEDHVFSEAALVQIAGRAGRSAQDPDGDVIFFHYGKTVAMRACRRQIQTMNREGEKI